MRIIFIITMLISLQCAYGKSKKVTAIMETTKGTITLELFADKAPLTVKNFVSYAKKGYYNGTIFHRVIGNFMIQGGGFDINLVMKATDKPIKNEARADVGNDVGTIAMARTGDPHSATSQFFINVSNNISLNHTSPSQRGYGYAVFGKVIKGMSVVNIIKKSATKRNGPHQNLPMENIIIKGVTIK
jgi:cyclophilin family peptidyl-prolyl cis-trans isomerase